MAAVLAKKPVLPQFCPDNDSPGPLCIPREAHKLDGFRAWVLSDEFPEKVNVTFLRGEILLDMSKEEIQAHALVKTEVGRVMANLNVAQEFGHVFINGVLISNEAAQVSNNPDAVAVFYESLERGLVRFITRKDRETEIEGSPDWVLEIVSDSSVVKDTQQLRESYHQAGIREYWLIDARGADVVFQILQWRKSGYVAATAKEGWLKSRVFGRSFRLSRRRDRRGAWQYSLAVR